jgi:hypothetical protein
MITRIGLVPYTSMYLQTTLADEEHLENVLFLLKEETMK